MQNNFSGLIQVGPGNVYFPIVFAWTIKTNF
nr:MAG TPA: hypothetical protein [Caudoviricetes sp.]